MHPANGWTRPKPAIQPTKKKGAEAPFSISVKRSDYGVGGQFM
jgi:hypothetical protein